MLQCSKSGDEELILKAPSHFPCNYSTLKDARSELKAVANESGLFPVRREKIAEAGNALRGSRGEKSENRFWPSALCLMTKKYQLQRSPRRRSRLHSGYSGSRICHDILQCQCKEACIEIRRFRFDPQVSCRRACYGVQHVSDVELFKVISPSVFIWRHRVKIVRLFMGLNKGTSRDPVIRGSVQIEVATQSHIGSASSAHRNLPAWYGSAALSLFRL